ncbi:uncharacterized protein LOC113865150 [Abrus precatorius]|uniref:Uncharacterized protein LOC113865150 n=1 Tax=Abrus precatorius TaxID=3816 RepID=A0A8B8LKI8_ABRPR|nr:uncharacterized protein LOC113865150 [Abrus precatorius]
MGRGRGKDKKLSVVNDEDPVSGEDEKVPMQRRRGRPQKLLKVKDDFDEEQVRKLEDHDDSGDNVKNGIYSEEIKLKSVNTTRHGRKRKRNLHEKIESIEEKNGVANGSKSNNDDLTKSNNGFRHNGNRRKSKPRGAAEAGVLCKQDYAVS